MKMILSVLVLFSTLSYCDTWEIEDSHSTARFKVKHLMISNVSGEITGMKGNLDIDGNGKLTAANATLNLNTINTQNEKRDGHLKSEDFFNTAKFPTISFKTTKVTQKGNSITLVGDMTMHGVTKAVTFTDGELTNPIKDPGGNNRRGFSAQTKISRKDFGITYNKVLESGGVALGDEVSIQVECEVIQSKTDKKS